MTYLTWFENLMDITDKNMALENKRMGMFAYCIWLNTKLSGKLKTYEEFQECKISRVLLDCYDCTSLYNRLYL